jgi:SAM-dependent methyltransferase
MSFSFHDDRSISFDYQVLNTKESVIPFIEEKYKLSGGLNVLEIGCGEGGVLKAFVEMGCVCVGVDFNKTKLNVANSLFSNEIFEGKIKFIDSDIYDVNFQDQFKSKFDLIILKDTIEHIYGHEKLMARIKDLLTDSGVVYLGFPPWQMPFGGHQQVCKNKLASLMPYYHLLPGFLYYGIARILGEDENTIRFLKETKDTRITPRRFERIVGKLGYKILNRRFYFIAPMYKYKFKLKPRKQARIISAIPILNNFFTTTCDYLISF